MELCPIWDSRRDLSSKVISGDSCRKSVFSFVRATVSAYRVATVEGNSRLASRECSSVPRSSRNVRNHVRISSASNSGSSIAATFNFLGFTHICGQSRKNGKFLVLRKTIRKRLLTKLKRVKDELRKRMHQPLAEVGKWLRSVVQGYFNYHAVTRSSCQYFCAREAVPVADFEQ